MRIGLQFPGYTWPGGPEAIGPTLLAIAKTADEVGFDSLWDVDHYFAMEPFVGTTDEPMLEAYSTLTYVAPVTQRIKLGTLVTGVIYRNPSFLVKQATGLDVLSGGRAYFGVGAAWYEREAKGYGFPFPSLGERFEWLEEMLQIARLMWSGEVKPFDGKHFQLAESLCNPMPISKPHPPIMIGGMGEKKTLKLVARYADACNLFYEDDLGVLTHKLDVLKQHCQSEDRDFNEIERTSVSSVHLAPGKMTAKDIIHRCRDLAGRGIQHAIFNMPNVHEIKPIEIFGKEVIPEIAGF